MAGLSPSEPFDVTPYAVQLSRHFMRHDLTQALPRKFKIGFDGCGSEGACIGASFQDIAALATVRDGRRGFRLYVGGGLGNTPKPARLFEDFTPAEDLVRTAHAIVELHNARSNRQNRNRARLKFLVQTLGWDEFKRLALEERDKYPSGWGPEPDFAVEETGAVTNPIAAVEPGDRDYLAWKRDNVIRQKQAGFSAVTVVLPLGDITSPQLRSLADLIALYSDGRARITIGQNILLRWVRSDRLPSLWKRLRAIELAEEGANTISDITACPGADTCNLGITSSKGLTRALRQSFREAGPEFEAARSLVIKISGCPNSCGQHHVADIGLHGAARKVGEVEIPSYNLLLGGSARPVDGDSEFGAVLVRIAARLVPAAVLAIGSLWTRERATDESFRGFVERLGTQRWKDLLGPFAEDPVAGKMDGLRVDWGQQDRFVTLKGMKGECAV